MSVNSYSRSEIISLFKKSLSQLRELSGQFLPFELVDSFTIRLKMMENLARIAFNYSIKVSYLDERKEYAHIAEMLDDVILQIRRTNIRYKASSYGFLVTREYEAMQDALDLLDERLKTVRVVCFDKRRDRNINFINKPEPRVTDNEIETTYVSECGCCYVDKNRYRKHDLYAVESTSPVNESSDSDGSMTKQFNKINVKNTNATLSAPAPAPSSPEEIAVKNESEKDFIEFTKITKIHLDQLASFSKDTTDNNHSEEKLTLQCNVIVDLFNLVIDSIETISSEPRCRKIQSNIGYSFMQSCIRKCAHLYNEIADKYDSIRRKNKRADPVLRAAKIEAMTTLQKADLVLCKYYTERPFEKESIQCIIDKL